MIKKLNYYFITLFIFGNLIEKYRGTWASLFTTLFLFTLIHGLKISILIISLTLILIFFYSFFAIKSCLINFSSEDPQEIVIDEFLGQSIPILFMYYPIQKGDPESAWIYLITVFILFRFFDILKPFPINLIDKKMKNGLGVVLDDLLAGIYVIIIFALFGLFFGPPFE